MPSFLILINVMFLSLDSSPSLHRIIVMNNNLSVNNLTGYIYHKGK